MESNFKIFLREYSGGGGAYWWGLELYLGTLKIESHFKIFLREDSSGGWVLIGCLQRVFIQTPEIERF